VNLYVETSEIENVVNTLSKMYNFEELYEVSGEHDIVTLISASNIEEFRAIIKNCILKIKGVKSAISSILTRGNS
jgi:DNA-binding Lrp family transcriptional regulator